MSLVSSLWLAFMIHNVLQVFLFSCGCFLTDVSPPLWFLKARPGSRLGGRSSSAVFLLSGWRVCGGSPALGARGSALVSQPLTQLVTSADPVLLLTSCPSLPPLPPCDSHKSGVCEELQFGCDRPPWGINRQLRALCCFSRDTFERE